MKADVYEGGHRVPFIVRWPARIKERTTSAAPTTLTNLAATCRELLGDKPVAGKTIDSYSILPVVLQQADTVPGQEAIVHHSSMGHFAVRQGDWKLIERPGSGGFSEPAQYQPAAGEPAGQLYNLADDPQETDNLYDKFPAKVAQLQTVLDKIRGTSGELIPENR
jgi:arylsulfatase A-like enzyme